MEPMILPRLRKNHTGTYSGATPIGTGRQLNESPAHTVMPFTKVNI